MFSVSKEMKTQPLVIAPNATLESAMDLMKTHGIRHLPVVDGDRLVGLLSDRGLRQALMLNEKSFLRVADVMIPAPLKTHPNAPVSEVITKMAKRKEDCAVVVDDFGKVIGILTTTDSLELLGRVLKADDAEAAENIEDGFWRA